MTDQQSSYRQIFKATTLFGGVQVFNIFISIIRSKFVAVLLGPTGMGIAGLLTSTTGFITALTNFGLGTSAVKSVAAAGSTGDEVKISFVVSVLRKLVWVTGLLGMVLTAVLSPWLSQLTFGNRDYTFAFIWISVSLLFQQLSSGQMVILQGLRKLHHLAKANISGAIIGLMISIPVYYIWKLKGIVPVIILSSLATMLLSWYFAGKAKILSIEITRRNILIEGKEMLKMGFVLSMSGLVTLSVAYIVRIYISNKGGVEQVGLYNAGFAIINTYVGMVFSAMSTDYFPRLSAVSNDNIRTVELINQQAEVALLIIAPILAVFLIFINWVVIMLYSQSFIAVTEMIQWAAIGMYFKAASWSIAFILLVKGDSNTFFWNELLANFYMLAFNIAGYTIAGLEGLGISFLVGYFIYFFQVFLVAKLKYSFSFYKMFYKIALFQFFLGILCFGTMLFIPAPWNHILGFALVIISTFYSFGEFEKRIGLKEILRRQVIKFRN